MKAAPRTHGRPRQRHERVTTWRVAVVVTAATLAMVIALVGPVDAPAGHDQGGRADRSGGTVRRGSERPGRPVGVARLDRDDTNPALARDLDAVVALSPPETCLRVNIDGEAVYGHRATEAMVPASTEKLTTARVVLDRLGPDHTFTTKVVATAAPVDGVVDGDLVIVGGGDPVLVTDAYRLVRRIGGDRAATSLDALADEVKAAGITRVTGRVLGDETRYDDLRVGPTWPDRYARQNQAGPLSALDVDDGYDLTFPEPDTDDPIRRDRSPDPAASAARLLTNRLLIRGVAVDAGPFADRGTAPPDAVDVASTSSPPLTELVTEMLLTSDNQIAELLTKELGREAGTGASTVAGAEVIDDRSAALGLDRTGADAVDGSGLDPANRASCDSLVSVLDGSGGLTGTIGSSLPVAGKTGTLRRQFQGTPAEGVLHAKTGSLNSADALAGFVELEGDRVATFAYLVNDVSPGTDLHASLELLGTVLATAPEPCPGGPGTDLVSPLGQYAAPMGNLAMFPLQSVLVPGALLPLHVFEDRYRALVQRCLAEDDDFGVTLIERGSEVGGGDVRTDVGTRARILQAEQAADGRWAVIALGLNRLRVGRWLADDPHPVAEVSEWPDPPAPSAVADGLDRSAESVKRLLALRTELGDDVAPATVDLSVDLSTDDPGLASFRLVSLSTLGELDRQRLLAAPSIEDRLTLLDQLLAEEEAVTRARLGLG